MSGVLKSLGKVFKAVTKPVVKLVKKQLAFDKMIRKKIWSNKYLRVIAIAVAAYFTAGAALAYFGAAGAAGGVAAAGAAASTGAAVGTTAMATGAAVGAATASTVAATTLSAVTVTATVGAAGVSAVTAGAIAAASVGVAAGVAASDAASSSASNAMNNGGGTTTGVPGGTTVGSDGIPTLGTTNVTADIPATGASNFGAFDAGELTPDLGFADNIGQVGKAEMNKVDAGLNANGTPKTMFDKAKDLVTNPFSSQNNVAQFDDAGNVIGAPAGAVTGTAPASGGLMGSMGKVMLLKSAVDFASAYMNKPPGPQDPLQYGGRDKNNNGPGMALHTIDNGSGLATGGTGQAPLTGGVPGVLRAGAAQMAPLSPIGSAGSFAAASSPSGPQPGTPPAGLVPQQGAINYMGSPS